MNYPKGAFKNIENKINYANRGMVLEKDIDDTNTYYLNSNIAIIYKKPTPIKITKVNYPSRNKAIIKEAFFKSPSTLDYNGLYKGKYLDFDAKETRSKTSYPISSIHKHQIEHIRNVIEHKGIAFLIVRFILLDENYLIKGEDLISFIDSNERKTIPLSYFKEKCYKIELKYAPRLDYLKIIDEILTNNKNKI